VNLIRSVRSRNLPRQVFALLILWCSALWAQAPASAPEERKQIEDAVKKFMAANSLPSVSVAVVRDGKYEWSAGFGMADLENSVPATSSTLYRLASISKSITATAAMLLYERTKLDLDAPVQKYCPAFPVKEAPITTRELLGHLGGIRHYRSQSLTDPEVVSTKHFDNPIAGGLGFFKDDPLVAKPGTKFSYSTHGYTLVGCIIEGASGQKYEDFVREYVLQPAGMNHTRIDDRLAIVPYRARFYSKDTFGTVVNAEPVDVSFKLPGDGWLSSAEDMAKFEEAMLNDHLVSRATRNLMWTPQKTSDGKETTYGLGWEIGSGFAPTINHGGGEWGTSTFIMMAPEQRAGVVVLINLNGGNASDLAPELLKMIIRSKQPRSFANPYGSVRGPLSPGATIPDWM
jgi:serine beta-lactamase-like protein LACTB, mitochondrial